MMAISEWPRPRRFDFHFHFRPPPRGEIVEMEIELASRRVPVRFRPVSIGEIVEIEFPPTVSSRDAEPARVAHLSAAGGCARTGPAGRTGRSPDERDYAVGRRVKTLRVSFSSFRLFE